MKKVIAISLFLVFLSFLPGCSTASSNSEKSSQKQEKFEYSVKVMLGGKVLKEYKLEDIKKILVKTIEVEGKTEEGPVLLEVLKDSGIKKFSKITFKSIDKSQLTLTSDKVDGDTLLDVANRGTVKLASKIVPKKDWIKDIVEIVVEE